MTATEIDAAGLDMLAVCVEANVRGLARTHELIRENDAARLVSMARAFIEMCDGLEAIPVHSRSVYIERLLGALGPARDEAERVTSAERF